MAEGHRERLIEKALRYGIESFQKHEVLELYLFMLIPRKDTNPIAHELIKNSVPFTTFAMRGLKNLSKSKASEGAPPSSLSFSLPLYALTSLACTATKRCSAALKK